MGGTSIFRCEKCQIMQVGLKEEMEKAAESHKRYTKHEVSVTPA